MSKVTKEGVFVAEPINDAAADVRLLFGKVHEALRDHGMFVILFPNEVRVRAGAYPMLTLGEAAHKIMVLGAQCRYDGADMDNPFWIVVTP